MAATKKFVVTVSANYGEEYALEPSLVYESLTSALGFTGQVWVDAVRVYDPTAPVYTSKIGVIKQIRQLLNSTLLDSKSMADAATALGKFSMLGITVTYDNSDATYQVTDYR